MLFDFYEKEIPKIEKFSPEGHVIAKLEIQFSGEIYKKYMNQKFKDIIRTCVNHIEKHTYENGKIIMCIYYKIYLALPDADTKILEDLMAFTQARMTLYTNCFS